MKSSRALVTGHHGFIGGRLMEALKDLGIETIGLEKDILSTESWKSDLQSYLDELAPSVIFHVGACADTLEQNVQSIMIENFESTKTLVDWSKHNNIPLVFSSSAANYGTNGLFPSNLYGWSKYVAEQYASSNGAIALRYFNVYGPGEEHKGNMASFVFQAHLKVEAGASIQLFPGKPLRDFVYIDDVVRANIHAWSNFETLAGNYYEVGSGEARPFEDMLNSFDISYTYATPQSVPIGYQYFTESKRAMWMAGWEPEHTIDSGLELYKRYLSEQ